MKPEEITALAREYAEECCPIEAYEKAELIDPYKEEVFERKADILATQIEFEQFLEWLLRRYALVERSKLEELKIAHRAKEHGAVWLNQWEAESLFPEIAKEV